MTGGRVRVCVVGPAPSRRGWWLGDLPESTPRVCALAAIRWGCPVTGRTGVPPRHSGAPLLAPNPPEAHRAQRKPSHAPADSALRRRPLHQWQVRDTPDRCMDPASRTDVVGHREPTVQGSAPPRFAAHGSVSHQSIVQKPVQSSMVQGPVLSRSTVQVLVPPKFTVQDPAPPTSTFQGRVPP